MAWSCIDSPKFEADRNRTFRQLYCTRLLQHPILLRRFTAMRYPMRSTCRPWLAEQIEVLRRLISGGNLHA